MDSLQPLSAAKLITCIVPRGEAQQMMQTLYNEYGLQALNSYTGRGQDSRMALKDWREMDIVNLVVPEAQADEVFDLMYQLAGIGQQAGRLLWQEHLPQATAFVVPNSI